MRLIVPGGLCEVEGRYHQGHHIGEEKVRSFVAIEEPLVLS